MDARTRSPFRSFWMVGYEGADHCNPRGHPLDMQVATGHEARIDEDYRAALALGFRVARESLSWRTIEGPGGYDFSRALRRAEAAQRAGMQVCWSLCHYGWPADVDVFSQRLVERFRRYASAAARALAPYTDGVPLYNPINEISFLSYAVCDTDWIHPYRRDETPQRAARGYALKMNLVRAALAGGAAIRDVAPDARLAQIEPIIHVVAPPEAPELADAAAANVEFQFQAWDMLCGRMEPALGGHPDALDLIGVNYYYNNQWEFGTDKRLHWHLRDPRRVPLRTLLARVHRRYQRPLFVAETGHFGAGRAAWIREVGDEVHAALGAGVPVHGICIYPAVDRPDWNDAQHWHNSGLWDLVQRPQGDLPRHLNETYAHALRDAQRLLALPAVKEPDPS